MNTAMPQNQMEHKIKDMEPEESGWTVPWALHVDAQQQCWLQVTFPIHTAPGGTAQMRVQLEADGWHVDISRCGWYHWTPETISGMHLVKIAALIIAPQQGETSPQKG